MVSLSLVFRGKKAKAMCLRGYSAFVSKPRSAKKAEEEKKLEMPKSIAVDDMPSLGAAAPFLLLFSPLLLVLADALQKVTVPACNVSDASWEY